VSSDIQSQHVQAIATIKELTTSDLSLRMATSTADAHHITYINNDTSTGNLYSQIKTMVNPAGLDLSNVHVFSSADQSLSLNMFSFNARGAALSASKADAAKITAYIAEVKAGKHANDKTVPKYSELFNDANMSDYISKITPSYASKSNPRRFLIQREMYEKVRSTEGVDVHIEPFEANSSWVTIAAANVLPEVMLRLCSGVVSAKGLDVGRAHLDSVMDPTNNTPDTAGNVTMLRLLLSSADVSIVSRFPLYFPPFLPLVCKLYSTFENYMYLFGN
jgi:hypothetical protein